jgi:hypothetical protein
MSTSEETEWQDVDVQKVDEQFSTWKKAGERQFARKPPMGRSVWRAAPPRKDRSATPFKEAWIHEIYHPVTGDFMFSGECPVKSGKGTFCTVCSESSRLRKTGKPADKERAKELRAKMKMFISAAQLMPAEGQEDFKPNEGFVPLELAIDAYKTLQEAFHETVAAGGNFTHPDTGLDLVFVRTPKKGPNGENWSDTTVKLAAKSTPLKTREWLKKLPDLELVAGQFNNEQAAALFRGEDAPASDLPPGDAPKQLEAAPEGSQPTAGGTWTHPGQGR